MSEYKFNKIDFIVEPSQGENEYRYIPISDIAKELIKAHKGVYMGSITMLESQFNNLCKSSPFPITTEEEICPYCLEDICACDTVDLEEIDDDISFGAGPGSDRWLTKADEDYERRRDDEQ